MTALTPWLYMSATILSFVTLGISIHGYRLSKRRYLAAQRFMRAGFRAKVDAEVALARSKALMASPPKYGERTD